LLHLLRENSRKLLLETGFLNKQKPDVILDELNRMLRRAKPTRREVELLIGAVAQVSRNR
jgi:tRNA C32,U32 (ribose-2'-O)-methylase TrmJ